MVAINSADTSFFKVGGVTTLLVCSSATTTPEEAPAADGEESLPLSLTETTNADETSCKRKGVEALTVVAVASSRGMSECFGVGVKWSLFSLADRFAPFFAESSFLWDRERNLKIPIDFRGFRCVFKSLGPGEVVIDPIVRLSGGSQMASAASDLEQASTFIFRKIQNPAPQSSS